MVKFDNSWDALLQDEFTKEYYLKLRDFLKPEEMGKGPGPRLLQLAYQNGEKDHVTAPADIIAMFETLEEQKQVAEILKDNLHFESPAAMEKAVNDMYRTIKLAWLNETATKFEQKDGESYLNAINTLLAAKRNLENQYITITNG